MVVVVLDPPGLKRIYERGKHECAHDVLCQLVLAECTVPTVMPNHKELQQNKINSETLNTARDQCLCLFCVRVMLCLSVQHATGTDVKLISAGGQFITDHV